MFKALNPLAWLGLAAVYVATNACSAERANTGSLNVVLIFTDDLGYGDLGAFSPTNIRTPNIDRLAQQGTRFTDFYVAQAVCTASRAALMTGCYSNRVGLAGALNHTSQTGIHADEELLPELLSKQGYATAMFGKWHLGLPPDFSPLRNGFDQWFGIPYSNDNTKYHPVLADSMPALPLFNTVGGQEVIIETDPDQSQFTRRLTERAITFLEENHTKPFFLYVPHIMPHVPIFASEAFAGKSGEGLYADVVAEIDWSVGRIVETVERLGLAEKTLIIFTSDNGPFLSYGSHAGSSGELREGKLTTFEGGVRVPTVMRWDGMISAGRVCREPLMTIDLLPTLCALTGARLPKAEIDGLDVSPVLLNDDVKSPHHTLVFYSGTELQAIRMGRWKLHFPHTFLTVAGPTRSDGKPAGWGELEPKSINESGVEGIASRHGYRVELLPLALYDLSQDVGEQRNVASENPQIVQQLTELANDYRLKLGDSLTGVQGHSLRSIGRISQ